MASASKVTKLSVLTERTKFNELVRLIVRYTPDDYTKAAFSAAECHQVHNDEIDYCNIIMVVQPLTIPDTVHPAIQARL